MWHMFSMLLFYNTFAQSGKYNSKGKAEKSAGSEVWRFKSVRYSWAPGCPHFFDEGKAEVSIEKEYFK